MWEKRGEKGESSGRHIMESPTVRLWGQDFGPPGQQQV